MARLVHAGVLVVSKLSVSNCQQGVRSGVTHFVYGAWSPSMASGVLLCCTWPEWWGRERQPCWAVILLLSPAGICDCLLLSHVRALPSLLSSTTAVPRTLLSAMLWVRLPDSLLVTDVFLFCSVFLSHASERVPSLVMKSTSLRSACWATALWSLGFERAMRMGRDERPCSWLCSAGAEWYELGLSSLEFTCVLFFFFLRSKDCHRNRNGDLCRMGDKDHH